MSRSLTWQVCCAAALCLPLHVSAETKQPLWEVGGLALAVSQPAYPGANQQTQGNLLLPYAVYRGEYFKADRGSAGVRAMRTPDVEVDVSATLAVGFNPNGVAARQGMPGLGTLLQVGPRIIWQLGTYQDLRWQAQWPIREVLEINSGLHARGIATEPELRFEARSSPNFNWGMSAGALFGDRSLNQMFYGVAPQESTASRPAYQAQAGLIAWRLGLFANYQVTQDVRLFMQNRWDNLSGAANTSSPLVKSEHGFATTVGLIYVFGRSPYTAP